MELERDTKPDGLQDKSRILHWNQGLCLILKAIVPRAMHCISTQLKYIFIQKKKISYKWESSPGGTSKGIMRSKDFGNDVKLTGWPCPPSSHSERNLGRNIMHSILGNLTWFLTILKNYKTKYLFSWIGPNIDGLFKSLWGEDEPYVIYPKKITWMIPLQNHHIGLDTLGRTFTI